MSYFPEHNVVLKEIRIERNRGIKEEYNLRNTEKYASETRSVMKRSLCVFLSHPKVKTVSLMRFHIFCVMQCAKCVKQFLMRFFLNDGIYLNERG